MANGRLLKLAISNDTVPLGDPVAPLLVAERFKVGEGQNQLELGAGQDASELRLVEKNRPFEPVSITPEYEMLVSLRIVLKLPGSKLADERAE